MVWLKGNRCEMGQGGTKPDDRLLRILPSGRRVRVTFIRGEDLALLPDIYKRVKVAPHWYDMARYVQEHPKIRVMTAKAFMDVVLEEEDRHGFK